jgi:uncharacterized membrane protein YgcG
MKLIALITAIAVLATTAVASAEAPLREYEGQVVSVNRDAKRFRLHDSERGTIRVHVNRNTRFERIDGMAGLRVGMRRVEVKVRRIDGRWIASEVEKSGGGGEHGGGDRGGGGGNSGPGSGGSNS